MARLPRDYPAELHALPAEPVPQPRSSDRLGCAVTADRGDLEGGPRLLVRTKPRRTETLPPADTVRWSPQRKALVVAAVQNGAISFEEACQRYELSAEELLAWQQAKQAYGIGALRVTRFQYYREVPRTK